MLPEKPVLTLLRSVLIFPANVRRFVEKAPVSGADAVCLDLEDSVPPAEKSAARESAADAIAALPRADYATFVRLNGPATGLLEEDLIAIVRPGLHGVIISKAESAADVLRVENYLTILERERGVEPESIAIVPLIETAAGIADCYAICCASSRGVAAVFGGEDFATDMGVERTPGGREILWARSQLAVASRAAGILSIDTPATGYADEAGLERDMIAARTLGYRGKLCIHPAQVAIANRIFSPSVDELGAARGLVDAFEREGIAKGRAAILFEGKMVDTPIYERARRLLEWQQSAGRLD